MDNELETIEHTLYHCHFLTGAFDIIDTAFRTTGPHPFKVSQLLKDTPALSLETPAGILG